MVKQVEIEKAKKAGHFLANLYTWDKDPKFNYLEVFGKGDYAFNSPIAVPIAEQHQVEPLFIVNNFKIQKEKVYG